MGFGKSSLSGQLGPCQNLDEGTGELWLEARKDLMADMEYLRKKKGKGVR